MLEEKKEELKKEEERILAKTILIAKLEVIIEIQKLPQLNSHSLEKNMKKVYNKYFDELKTPKQKEGK